MQQPFLVLSDIDAGYGKKQVLFGVSLTVNNGEIVALIGHNGAGKTTVLRSIFGHVAPRRGGVTLAGNSIDRWSRAERVRRGLTYIPQEGFVFGALSVQENLDLAAFILDDRKEYENRLDECFAYLPLLKERRRQRASTLSGGQQRMLSLGMILILRPAMLLLDEPSLGLAPSLVDRAMALLRDMVASTGMTVLLVEQNVQKAFGVSDRVYVLRGGRVIAERPGGELTSREELWALF